MSTNHRWNVSTAGYKLRPGPFVSEYLCISCGHTFYDNPYLPTRVGITCPWCGVSHYTEETKDRLRGATGACVRQIYKTIDEIETVPKSSHTIIAIATLKELIQSIIRQ
jgi:predicted  nucleic acid-binding Zn-ribbon protein